MNGTFDLWIEFQGDILEQYWINTTGTLNDTRVVLSEDSYNITALEMNPQGWWNFTWEDIREPVMFGLKTGIPGIFGGITNFYILNLYITYFPQYATFSTMVGLIGTMLWIMREANPQAETEEILALWRKKYGSR